MNPHLDPKIIGFDLEHFDQDENGNLETVAHVHISIPVGLVYDVFPTRADLILDALDNIRVHPALDTLTDLQGYCDKIVLDRPARNNSGPEILVDKNENSGAK